jgi:hypothetical protein
MEAAFGGNLDADTQVSCVVPQTSKQSGLESSNFTLDSGFV